MYFPHGHIRFQFDKTGQAIWYPAQELAEFERWYNIDATFAGCATKTKFQGKFAYNYNTFISTGQAKDEWLNRLPFAVYYQRLAIDVAKSTTIYIIGYSFGDSHINRLLGSFLRLSRENSLYIVDLYKKDVNDISKSGKHEGIMQNISRFFKTFFIPFYLDDANAEQKYLKEINEVNDKGYGKIADQVIFYKKGYESFLKEYKDVLSEVQS